MLARALQFDDPKAVYTAAFYDGTSRDPGTFGLVVVPVPGVGLAEAEAALDATLARFLKEGIDMDALARIRFQMRAEEVYARDDIDRLARRYGEALAVGLTRADVEEWPALLQSVTPEEVMAAAAEVLDRRRSVTGWLSRPEGETQ